MLRELVTGGSGWVEVLGARYARNAGMNHYALGIGITVHQRQAVDDSLGSSSWSWSSCTERFYLWGHFEPGGFHDTFRVCEEGDRTLKDYGIAC
jgi:hypothetical protein